MDLIVGYGEIGKALFDNFNLESTCEVYDPNIPFFSNKPKINSKLICLHICFPFSKNFVQDVKKYIKKFNPEFTVIHSTVPVGTCRKIGKKVVHSPVVGIHPNLTESINIFTKFLGCSDKETLAEAADHFRRNGLTVYVFDKPETTELMKILCTTNYGLNIEFTKEVKRLCDKYNVPFEAFTIWNNNYNEGYEKLGHPEYHRYNLIPLMKNIGAHCVLPNCDLLNDPFTKLIKDLNGKN